MREYELAGDSGREQSSVSGWRLRQPDWGWLVPLPLVQPADRGRPAIGGRDLRVGDQRPAVREQHMGLGRRRHGDRRDGVPAQLELAVRSRLDHQGLHRGDGARCARAGSPLPDSGSQARTGSGRSPARRPRAGRIGDFSFGLRNRPDDTLAYTDFDHNEAGTLPFAELVDGDPLAGVRQLAREVKQSGVRRVGGDVVVDNRLFSPYKDWPDGRIDSIWLNENLIDIEVFPTSEGKPARVEWRPHTGAYRVEGKVSTGRPGAENHLEVTDSGGGVVTVTGQIAADAGRQLEKFVIPNPARFARTAFIEALERAGVRVDASSQGANPKQLLPERGGYPSGKRLAEFVSPPLSEYVKVVLKVSYNRGAQLLGCLVVVENGGRNCKYAAGRTMATVAPLGVSRASTFLFDPAGSVDDARTTPHDMSEFIDRLRASPMARRSRPASRCSGATDRSRPRSRTHPPRDTCSRRPALGRRRPRWPHPSARPDPGRIHLDREWPQTLVLPDDERHAVGPVRRRPRSLRGSGDDERGAPAGALTTSSCVGAPPPGFSHRFHRDSAGLGSELIVMPSPINRPYTSHRPRRGSTLTLVVIPATGRVRVDRWGCETKSRRRQRAIAGQPRRRSTKSLGPFGIWSASKSATSQLRWQPTTR